MFKHINDKLKPQLQKILNIALIFLTVSSFILSFIGITNQNTLEWYVVISIVLFNSILLMIISIIATIFYQNYKKQLDCLNKINKMKNLEHEESIKKINKLILYNRFTNGTLNKFLPKLYDINDTYFEDLERIKEFTEAMASNASPDISIFEKKQNLISSTREKYYSKLIEEYKSILGIFSAKLKLIVEDLLSNQQSNINISVTIKLFNQILDHGDDHTNIIVYTAFRDAQTYMEEKREVCKRTYKIHKNSAFLHCLQENMYICNNLDKKSKSYMNENKEFEQYYNSSITTPIQCQYMKPKKIFGYLIIDTYNNESNKVFDEEIGNLVYSTALQLGAYFDNVSYTLEYVLESYVDFLEFMYKYNFNHIEASDSL